jgi:hypothetical protein
MSEDTNDQTAGPPNGRGPDSGHDPGGALRDADDEQPLEGRRERSDQPRSHLRRVSGKTELRHCRRGRRS